MAVFFVDYTSARAKGVNGIEMLSEDDKVYIYYNTFTSNIPFKFFESIKKSAANVVTIDMGFKFITEPIALRMATMIGIAASSDCGSVVVISDNVPLCKLESVIAAAKPKAKVVFEKSIGGALKALSQKNPDKKGTDAGRDIKTPFSLRQGSDESKAEETDKPPIMS